VFKTGAANCTKVIVFTLVLQKYGTSIMKVFQNISVPVIPSAKKENQYYALVFLLLEDSFKDF